MILKRFTNIYPRIFWVATIDSEEDLLELTELFTFYLNKPGFNEVNVDIKKDLYMAHSNDSLAGCYPVMLNDTSELGVLTIIHKPEFVDGETISHESVHTADYFFEVTGMSGQNFSDDGGNEGYAYLVGWAAGCFIKIMKEYGETK